MRQEAKRQGLTWTSTGEGSRHEVFQLDGLMIPIPRHNEIGEMLAETIFKECEPRLGKRWWK